MGVHQFVDGHVGLTVCSVVYPSLQARIVGSQEVHRFSVVRYIFKSHQRMVWGDGSDLKGSGGFSHAVRTKAVVWGL